jgi:hypothetical protein
MVQIKTFWWRETCRVTVKLSRDIYISTYICIYIIATHSTHLTGWCGRALAHFYASCVSVKTGPTVDKTEGLRMLLRCMCLRHSYVGFFGFFERNKTKMQIILTCQSTDYSIMSCKVVLGNLGVIILPFGLRSLAINYESWIATTSTTNRSTRYSLHNAGFQCQLAIVACQHACKISHPSYCFR